MQQRNIGADIKDIFNLELIAESRIEKLLHPFIEKQPFVETLVSHSFLTEPGKRWYLLMYNTKRNYLIAK
ncbi:MAG: hypothetical protein ACOCW7_03560 [Bacteroidota bacterium]